MDLCRSILEVWNKTEFGHVQRKISKTHKHLQCLEKQYSMPNIIKATCDTRKELNDWLDKEYAMSNQRSNITWLQMGDSNTSFLHAKASSHFQRNNIDRVYDEIKFGKWRNPKLGWYFTYITLICSQLHNHYIFRVF